MSFGKARKIVQMIDGIYESAGLEQEYFTDADLKSLARATVAAYLAGLRQKKVNVRQASFALKVLEATSGAEVEKAARDLSGFETTELLRMAGQCN